MRIFGIYQSDGGFVAELGYLFGKIRGTTHCQLCDITHNILWKKTKWKRMNDRLLIPVETLYWREAPAASVPPADGGWWSPSPRPSHALACSMWTSMRKDAP